MKQVIQNYKNGQLQVEEVCPPALSDQGILVETKASLISAGTERTKVETARMNIVDKAFSRLDLVKVVLNNIKQEGIAFTVKKAWKLLRRMPCTRRSVNGIKSGLAVGMSVVAIATPFTKISILLARSYMKPGLCGNPNA